MSDTQNRFNFEQYLKRNFPTKSLTVEEESGDYTSIRTQELFWLWQAARAQGSCDSQSAEYDTQDGLCGTGYAQRNGEAVGFVTQSAMDQLRKGHPAKIYAPENRVVTMKPVIRLYANLGDPDQ